MLKRLSILLMTLLLVVPVMAQPEEGCECVFGPKAGQFQFNLNYGPNSFFNDLTGLYYMLPAEDGSATGLGTNGIKFAVFDPTTGNQVTQNILSSREANDGLGNEYLSADLSTWLVNSGSLNYTLKDFSVGMKYFITDHLNINLSAAYLLNMQPSKDFVEGETYELDPGRNPDVSDTHVQVSPGDIFAQKAILGAVTNRLMSQLGLEWYFNTKNQRIFPYLGIFGQFKMSRIDSFYPSFTGMLDPKDVPMEDVNWEEADIWLTPRAAQALGFGGGINFGIEYALMEGLFIGAEVAPVCYQYTLLHMQAQGQEAYYATNHNLRAFAFPKLTIGVRF